MRVEIGIILLFVAVAYATDVPTAPVVNSGYDYHRRFGIPLAQKIKQKEDGIHNQRIAGGSFTTTLSVPYQAGIIMQVLIFTSVCGGALINDNTVLTSARCYDDGVLTPTSVTVVLGSNLLFSGGTRLSDPTVTVHPNYNPREILNDIAVTRTPRVTFSITLQAIETPLLTSEITNNFADYIGTASGYGITSDGDSIGLLQTMSSAELKILPNEECVRVYQDVIQNSHLCTSGVGGVGICDGDIGGPLVVSVGFFRKILVGIGSFYAADGCQIGLPSGFTRITYFLGWIASV